MPKAISQTPSWLSRPSPGARIFSDPSTQSPTSPSKRNPQAPSNSSEPSSFYSPKRVIAQRGTEIFVAVGNKIRWADLATVKDNWEDSIYNRKKQDENEDSPACYRTLSAPVYYQIRQLILSPSGTFLAICTEHTVHVSILPEPSRLREPDSSPVKLKTYQIGPTTHVLPESPLASVLWHPLAVATRSTDCLVTITTEAALRLWEVDRSNQWSFERPALALDLRKLADGISADQDFEPSGFGRNRGFSVDDIDMEVASACFGGRGLEAEDPWASMTLWAAMKNGDIYAMCPLLPSRWQPTGSTIPALSTSAVARMATIPTEKVDDEERRAADQQYEWVQEIDSAEPMVAGGDEALEVRIRPAIPSIVPRLQGPFELLAEDDDIDMDVTDITVFAASLDESNLSADDEDYNDYGTGAQGLPFTTIAVALSDGQVYIALDLDGVSGQWLPRKGRSTFGLPDSVTKDLAILITVQLEQEASVGQLMLSFTLDPIRQYTTYVTTGSRLHSISLDEWSSRLAAEALSTGNTDSGLKTRLISSCSSDICVIEEVVKSPQTRSDSLSAPMIIDDAALGYLLVSASSSEALAVTFDQPHQRQPGFGPDLDFRASQDRMSMQLVKLDTDEVEDSEPLPSRPAYVPPSIFYKNPRALFQELRKQFNHRQTSLVAESPMRLSPAMLDIMTFTHRSMSRHTTELESGAAELFRKCERLREELGDQVNQMVKLADRLQILKYTDGDEDNRESRKSHEERLALTQEKQETMSKRYEALRRKVAKVGVAKKELSARELSWMSEINELNDVVGETTEQIDIDERTPDSRGSLLERYDTVSYPLSTDSLPTNIKQAKHLSKHFIEEANAFKQTVDKSASLERSDSAASRRSFMSSTDRPFVSNRYQKERIEEVMTMVEREGAVIEAVQGRLKRLKI